MKVKIDQIREEAFQRMEQEDEINRVFNYFLRKYSISLQKNRRDVLRIANLLKRMPYPAVRHSFRKTNIWIRILLIFLASGLISMEWPSILISLNAGLPVGILSATLLVTNFFPLLYIYNAAALTLKKPNSFRFLGWLLLFDLLRYIPLMGIYLNEEPYLFLTTVILRIITAIQSFYISVNLSNQYEFHQSYYETPEGGRKKKQIIKFLKTLH